MLTGRQPTNEWFVHVLMDALYARRIAAVLDMESERSYWDSLIQRMTAVYPEWFWDKGGTFCQQTDRTGGHSGPDFFQGVEGLLLPPEILKSQRAEQSPEAISEPGESEDSFYDTCAGQIP